jgi:hypothetical protein
MNQHNDDIPETDKQLYHRIIYHTKGDAIDYIHNISRIQLSSNVPKVLNYPASLPDYFNLVMFNVNLLLTRDETRLNHVKLENWVFNWIRPKQSNAGIDQFGEKLFLKKVHNLTKLHYHSFLNNILLKADEYGLPWIIKYFDLFHGSDSLIYFFHQDTFPKICQNDTHLNNWLYDRQLHRIIKADQMIHCDE